MTCAGVHDELVSSAYRSATIALAVIAIISIVIIILLIIYILRKPLTKGWFNYCLKLLIILSVDVESYKLETTATQY